MGLFRRTPPAPVAPPPPTDDQLLNTLAAVALVADADGWIALTPDEEAQLIFAQHEARRRGLF